MTKVSNVDFLVDVLVPIFTAAFIITLYHTTWTEQIAYSLNGSLQFKWLFLIVMSIGYGLQLQLQSKIKFLGSIIAISAIISWFVF